MTTSFAVLVAIVTQSTSNHMIISNSSAGHLTFSDASQRLQLTLDTDHKCVLSSVLVRGKEVAAPDQGGYSGLKTAGVWYTSLSGIPSPRVVVSPDSVRVTGIHFGGDGISVEETWQFSLVAGNIQWRIDRKYLVGGVLQDSACPGWCFRDMQTWTGGILSTGGVAWCKLFDAPNASYGVHTDSLALWNHSTDSYLEIDARPGFGDQTGLRFTRQPNDVFSIAFEPSHQPLITRHGQARFMRDRQDIWADWSVPTASTQSVTYTLSATPSVAFVDRGDLKGIEGQAVGDILNTIGRIGVIDEKIMGSNGWYSGYAVLHEPWLSLAGLAIDDPKFIANMARTIDFQRDHAIAPDGMVKSRWAYNSGDSIPGTYDAFGFYECQWGRLMDTQTSYVMNVAEQFNLTGDVSWVRGQKNACEAALDYLLRRDTNGNHLVEMENDSWKQHKSSDWLDVVWASYESAYVNAQLYRALNQLAEIEQILGDMTLSKHYTDFATELKVSFNKPTEDGGFWDAKNRWYVYWREKDGSIHGNNLVLPVNFMAIAYGICDDPARREAILKQTEQKMAEENLFCWPVNIFPYQPTDTGNGAFPTYENGDIFLGWAQMGIAAYAKDRPSVAVKYVKRVLEQYKKDGLAFQRYLRGNQAGAGDDILANNSSAVVGLYRDIYGIQPRYNRLYLAPHINEELSGTSLRYLLRNQLLHILLAMRDYGIEYAGWKIHCSEDFGVHFANGGVVYFHHQEAKPSLSIQANRSVEIRIESWGTKPRWVIRNPSSKQSITQAVFGLIPGGVYRVRVGDLHVRSVTADSRGLVRLVDQLGKNASLLFELSRV